MTLWGFLALEAASNFRELGYACSQKVGADSLPCLEVATCVSGWPTVGAEQHRCCAAHAAAWARIADAMGFAITSTPLPVRRVLAWSDDSSIRAGLLELD